MHQLDWVNMLCYQQEFHRLSRTLLPQGQKETLTASERELLALLYLQPGENTPLSLSRESGMKKEAVSRSLKRLHEKGCIGKEKHPKDERSYILSLTEEGQRALQESYSAILKPLYQLRRQMGPEFATLMSLVCKANEGADGTP